MNLDCTDIKAMLSGLVDGELDAETRHLAERHLSQCAACRALVSEAEALNALIVSDAHALGSPALPAGFEDTVLDRTVYGRAYQAAGRSWTSWFGWVAAAASLGLASAVYFLDLQVTGDDDRLTMDEPRGVTSVDAGYTPALQSSINPGGVLLTAHTAEDAPAALDDAMLQQISEQLALVQPTDNRRVLEELSARPTLSQDEANALYSASNVLELLAEADLTSFADIEQIRAIAEYDELLPRLASARANLSPADRPAVLAAESILLRIVEGPINLADAKLLTDTARAMDLSAQIAAVSNRAQTASSL